MNDDFLRNLRRPPTAAFERQLRERLRDQELHETPRRRPSWKLLTIAMLIGGTALATATYLAMNRAPSLPSPATQVTSTERNEFTTQGPSTTKQQSMQWWNSSDIAASPRASASSQPTTSPEQANAASSATEAATGDTSPAGGTQAGGAISLRDSDTSKQPVVRIAVTPDIEAIAKDTLPQYGNWARSAVFEADSAAPALRQLCTGSAEHSAIVISSQRMGRDERNACNAPAVGGVLEATLGHAAIVVTGARIGSPMQLSRDAVLLAVLKRVPSPEHPSRLIDNPYRRWNQINGSLEDRSIEIFGPERDSPAFHVFAAALLEPACDKHPAIQALQHTDRKAYEEICFSLREDGVYNETRLDSTFIRQRLWSDPNIVAVVDYPFYANNSADLLGSLLVGAPATRDSILNGNYGASRPIYFYIAEWRYERDSRVRSFVNEYLLGFYSRALTAPDGITEWRPNSRPVPLTEVK